MRKTGSNGMLAAMVIAAIAATAVGAQDKTVPRSLVKFAQQTLVTYGEDPQLVAMTGGSPMRAPRTLRS